MARIRVAFVGAVVAGHETQFRNVCAAATAAGTIDPVAVAVNPWQPNGSIERLRFLPTSLRATLRSVVATAPVAAARPDAIWGPIDAPLLPWLYLAPALRHVPLVYNADSTPSLLRAFGAHYGYWGGHSKLKHALRDHAHRMFVRRASVVTAWSWWAARSLIEDYGVDQRRVTVLPPGVDTRTWRPGRRSTSHGRPRVLFVGGDFERKGGDLLLDVFRTQFSDQAELDLVTRASIPPQPGVRVHADLGPNDPRLVALYQQADVFVLPTRADCFSMAGLEALASGVPVIICPVGGVAELFEPGREGLFVAPEDGRGLTLALRTLLDDGNRRREMGARGRALALARYDARKNADALLQIITGLLAERYATPADRARLDRVHIDLVKRIDLVTVGAQHADPGEDQLVQA